MGPSPQEEEPARFWLTSLLTPGTAAGVNFLPAAACQGTGSQGRDQLQATSALNNNNFLTDDSNCHL